VPRLFKAVAAIPWHLEYRKSQAGKRRSVVLDYIIEFWGNSVKAVMPGTR
jgi:hypothetical protein